MYIKHRVSLLLLCIYVENQSNEDEKELNVSNILQLAAKCHTDRPNASNRSRCGHLMISGQLFVCRQQFECPIYLITYAYASV